MRSLLNLPIVILPAFLLSLAFAGFRVNLSLFALSLGASPFTVGVAVSLLAILPMIFAVTAGRVIDRIGVHKPMLLAACAMITGLGLAFAVPRLEILFIVSPLVGSGFMLFHIAVNHATGTNEQLDGRVRDFDVIALTYSISGFLGPLLTGFAIDWIGHPRTFLFLMGSVLIAIIVLLVTKKNVSPCVPAGSGGKKRRLADLLQNYAIRRVFIVSGSLSMASDLFNFIVPVHCTSIGMSASAVGLILGAFGVGIFFVRLLLALFVRHLSEWQMLTMAMITTGIFLFAFPLVHVTPVLTFFAFMLGVALGGAQPVIMSLLYKHAPPGRGGEVVGMSAALMNLSQVGVPLLFGALITGLSMTPGFWTMTAVIAGASWQLRRRSASL